MSGTIDAAAADAMRLVRAGVPTRAKTASTQTEGARAPPIAACVA